MFYKSFTGRKCLQFVYLRKFLLLLLLKDSFTGYRNLDFLIFKSLNILLYCHIVFEEKSNVIFIPTPQVAMIYFSSSFVQDFFFTFYFSVVWI